MSETTVPASRERLVLGAVEELVRELDAGGIPRTVGADASLDRDLGIGSLERVELLLRVEAATGVRLPDHVMANAGTVRDLLIALDAAGSAHVPDVDGPPAPVMDEADGAAAPTTVRSLVETLDWHASRTPDRVHILLHDDEGRVTPLTYGALWREATEVANGLAARGVARGERVALLLRTERAFFTSYFGILLAGAAPVPLYPPFRADQIQEYATRQAAILRNAGVRVLITFDQAERVAGLLKPLAPSLTHVTTVADLGRAGGGQAGQAGPLVVSPDALALIQYTSGSTGAPKGVALSHANLLANIRAFGTALQIQPDDIGVSWLPLYHDMGLIGAWLGMLHHGVPVAILSPMAFLTRPSRWLRAIHANRATITAAPNFAYDLCARKIPDDELEGLDLRSWRAALNGAEAVHVETIERFTTRFAPLGFRPEAMCPVYGLAETSLCLTVPTMNTRPRVDRIAREPFQQARAIRPAATDEPALAFVGCGRPVPTTELRVVDDGGAVVGERVEGRIQFRGPSATAGYYRNAEATAQLIEHGWLNTGDLGYLADGEIFITGRRKDVIIAGGRNIYPQEIEEAVADIAGVRRGCIAAFGSADEATGTERLVVVAESRARDAAAKTSIVAEATRCVLDLTGVQPYAIVLVRPGSIPKTSSGKIRRQATRDLFEQGQLHRGRASAAAQWIRLLLTNASWRFTRAVSWLGAALHTFSLWLIVGIGLIGLRLALLVTGGGETGGVITRGWCRAVFRLGWFDVEVEGREGLAEVGPAVFVANHASYMDAMLMRAELPPHVRMAAKDRLLTYPFVGPIIGAAHVVSITRGRQSTADELAAIVRDGGSFAIFPEGTFMRAPGLLPFRLGAFRAAAEAGRPVIPVALVGTRDAWPDETLLVRRRPLRVIFGAPLRAADNSWPEMVRLRDRARAWLAEQTGEPAFQYHTDDSQARASGQV